MLDDACQQQLEAKAAWTATKLKVKDLREKRGQPETSTLPDIELMLKMSFMYTEKPTTAVTLTEYIADELMVRPMKIFYATPPGEAPISPNGEKWHNKISDGEDLLKIKSRQQRETILNNKSPPELELPHPSTKWKAVHPQPAPALDDALDYSAATQPSLPTAEPEPPTFWFRKTPNVKLFRPSPDESDALEAINN